MRKLIMVLVILLGIILIFLIISYFYPVSEIKGYIRSNEQILFQINRNGAVNYWANYSNDVFEKGTEGGTKFNNCKNVHKQMWLNVFEKIRINAYVKSIKEIDNINYVASQATDAIVYCIIIDGTDYYSLPLGSSRGFNREVYILSMMMWGLRPQECDEAFSSVCWFPEEWFVINRLNYMKYINNEFVRVEEIERKLRETYEQKLLSQ